MFPNIPGYPKGSPSSESRSAEQLLRWLGRNTTRLPQELRQQVQTARSSTHNGAATTNRVKIHPGMPPVHGPRTRVQGTDDEVYGPGRVEAVVEVVRQALNTETPDEPVIEFAIQLREQCRGDFAQQYRILDQAINLARARHRRAE